MAVSSAKKSVDCRTCVHYYITWDPRFPHGCNYMGFKGKYLPNREVRIVSNGLDCMAYSPKKKTAGPAANKKGDFRITV